MHSIGPASVQVVVGTPLRHHPAYRGHLVDLHGALGPTDLPLRVLRLSRRGCIVLSPESLARFIGAYAAVPVRFDLSPNLALFVASHVRHSRRFRRGPGYLSGLRFAEPQGEVCELLWTTAADGAEARPPWNAHQTGQRWTPDAAESRPPLDAGV